MGRGPREGQAQVGGSRPRMLRYFDGAPGGPEITRDQHPELTWEEIQELYTRTYGNTFRDRPPLSDGLNAELHRSQGITTRTSLSNGMTGTVYSSPHLVDEEYDKILTHVDDPVGTNEILANTSAEFPFYEDVPYRPEDYNNGYDSVIDEIDNWRDFAFFSQTMAHDTGRPLNETEQRYVDAASAADKLAAQLHEEWRAPRRQEDGSFEPRIKTTKDEEWIDNHGSDQVDIANTDYADLPSDWQEENKKAADAAVGSVLRASEIADRALAGDLNSLDFTELASDAVHEAWLERNGEWAEEEQKLPYWQLSQGEKEKDRAQVRAAFELMSQESQTLRDSIIAHY